MDVNDLGKIDRELGLSGKVRLEFSPGKFHPGEGRALMDARSMAINWGAQQNIITAFS
jgi:hypothetical protein